MKQLFFSTTLVVLLFTQFISAQCPPGNVTLSNQQEVDQFIVDYPNCTKFKFYHTLTIEGNSITNLNGLGNLTAINDLTVSQTGLTDLTGLQNLTEILALRIKSNNV